MESVIEQHAGEFEKHLKHSLGDAMACALRGGKRLRALCVLAVVKCYSPAAKSASTAQTGLHTAAAVEFIHAATCVIDDMHIFDGSLMRRGRPSVPTKYGPAVAVLAAGNLLVHVMDMILREPDLSLGQLRRMQAALTTTCDLTAEGQLAEEDGEADALSVARRKTGALFGLSCALGGILCNLLPEDVVRLHTQGEALGVLLQMVDDGVDVEEDRARDRPGNNTLIALGPDAYLAQAKLHAERAAECRGLAAMAGSLHDLCKAAVSREPKE